VQEGLSELSPLYPVFKTLFLLAMLVLGILFFLAGDEEEVVLTKAYQPVVAEVSDYQVIVQQVGLDEGAILAMDENRDKYILLPRPGKAFVVRPGDRLQVKALPFRCDQDGSLIVKTLEINNVR
jgi:hypothetical protein